MMEHNQKDRFDSQKAEEAAETVEANNAMDDAFNNNATSGVRDLVDAAEVNRNQS